MIRLSERRLTERRGSEANWWVSERKSWSFFRSADAHCGVKSSEKEGWSRISGTYCATTVDSRGESGREAEVNATTWVGAKGPFDGWRGIRREH